MKRLLVFALFSLFIGLSSPAWARLSRVGPGAADFVQLTDAGELPQLFAKGEGSPALPLEHTAVRARVTGHVARVEVTQQYGNFSDRAIEAVYVFPLPQNAAIDDFKLVVGERTIEGLMQPRDQARRTYEQARRAGHTAALLEQERPNIFTQSVANLPPGEAIEVVVRYVQTLTYDAGTYEFVFPMVVGPRYLPGAPQGGRTGTGTHADTTRVPDASRISPPYLPAGIRSGHDISVDVELEAGLPVQQIDAPTHEVDLIADGELLAARLARGDTVPNRDFVLRWKVAGEEPVATVLTHKGSRGGFFTVILQPPDLDVDGLVGRREIIFVVDVSGSMNGLPLWLAKETMREALGRLRPVDTFDVLTFAGATRRAFGTPRKATPENLAAAFAVVDGLRAGGGTELRGAVKAALSPSTEDGRHRYVVFLTDGYVGNEAAILADTARFVEAAKSRSARARVFGIGLGSSVNRYLIDGLGEQGRGLSRVVTNREEPVGAVEGIFAVIDHPILEDVSLDFGDLAVRDVQPARSPDLFLSRPLVFHGRYDKGGAGTVTLTARAPSGRRVRLPVTVRLPSDQPANGALASLWARAKVADLVASAWGGADVREEVTRLGVDFRIMTPYTSFVAVDRSRVVGDGRPETVVQPVEAPEDVDVEAAGGARLQYLAKTVRRTEHHGTARAGSAGTYVGPAAPGDGLVGGGGMGQAMGGGGLGIGGLGTRGLGGYGSGKQWAERPRGTATVSEVTIKGALDEDVVRRVFHQHRSQPLYCYERELLKDPTIQGKVSIRAIIDARGRVARSRIAGTTLSNEKVAECLRMRVATWQFPLPKGGGTAEVIVEWTFATSE